MSIKLEIERRFLIKFPNSWANLSEMLDDLVDIKRISQTYLTPEKDEPAVRIRKTTEGLVGDTDIVYHFNQKKSLETGVHQEKEHEITKSKYDQYMKKADPNKFTVNKTRFVFKFEDQLFELDVFKGPLKGLAILEIELKNKKDKVKLPPFLTVIKEVTNDKKFSNFSLANKK